jgi:hypothetical protein
MANIVTNVGEEFIAENDITGVTFTFTLFNNSTDSLGETSNLADITTEPTGSAFARQSSSVSALQSGGDFGIENGSLVAFDVSDSSATVDHSGFIVTFQADTVEGQGSSQDNLIGLTALTQSRDLSQIDTLEFGTGDLTLLID